MDFIFELFANLLWQNDEQDASGDACADDSISADSGCDSFDVNFIDSQSLFSLVNFH